MTKGQPQADLEEYISRWGRVWATAGNKIRVGAKTGSAQTGGSQPTTTQSKTGAVPPLHGSPIKSCLSPMFYGLGATNGVYIFKGLKKLQRKVVFCEMSVI